MSGPPIPNRPMQVIVPSEPAQDDGFVPCTHIETANDRRISDAQDVLQCVDCGQEVPDLTCYRYDTPDGACDHPATVTRRMAVVDGSGAVIATTEQPLTYCLVCTELTPAQEDANP